jgi:hypothetical protein
MSQAKLLQPEEGCQLTCGGIRLDSGMVSPPHFDYEKLDVYQLELKFLSWVTQFLAELSSRALAPTRELREQLDRASLSALLNTAEGNGRRQGASQIL